MANQDVIVRMGAQDAELVAAWQRAKRGPEGMAQELDKLKNKGNQARQSLGDFTKSQLAQWTSVATGVGLASRALTGLLDVHRKLRQESADTTFSLDEVFRKFQLQAGLNDAQGAAAREQLFGIAQRQAMPVEQVTEVGRQLASSGFTAEETLQGGATESFVKAMKASAIQGQEVDARQLAESVTQFILAQQKPADKALTKQNLERALQQTQGLFLKRNIQFADLSELANAAPALGQANIDPTEQLTLFTKLRDVMTAEESSTALRNVVSRLQTAGAHKPKIEALESLGLKPADVDFQGENMGQILERLAKGLEKVDQATGAIALTKLFEERGRAGAQVLIEGRGQLPGFRKEAEDTSSFEKALKVSTEGPAAAKTRLAVQKQQKLFGDASDELMAMAIEASGSKEEGARGAAEFRLARHMMIPQETAFALSTSTFGENSEFAQEARRNLQGSLSPDRESRTDTAKAIMDRALERAGDFGRERTFLGFRKARSYKDVQEEDFEGNLGVGEDPALAAARRVTQRIKTGRAQGEGATPEGKAMLEELRKVVRVLQEMAGATAATAANTANKEAPARNARRGQPSGPPLGGLRD